jgi:hypothetical protein
LLLELGLLILSFLVISNYSQAIAKVVSSQKPVLLFLFFILLFLLFNVLSGWLVFFGQMGYE